MMKNIFLAGLIAFSVSFLFTASLQAFPQEETRLSLLPDASIEGYSVKKRPVKLYKMGNGTNSILYIGAMHGNESQGKDVLFDLMDYLRENPQLIKDKQVLFVPAANPDGLAAGTRWNAHGVDLNRNFPAHNWKKTRKSSRFYSGQRTPEPETKTLMRIVKKYRPESIVTIHTPHYLINYDGPAEEISFQMAKRNHYSIRRYMGYRTPGSFGTYFGKERGIPIITLELSQAPYEKAWSENRLALLTLLSYSNENLSTNATPAFFDLCRQGNTEEISNMSLKGTNIYIRDQQGWNALSYAVYFGNEELVRYLVSKNFNVNTWDNLGWTPLMQASQKGYTNIIKILLDAGAQVNTKDNYGNTAVLHAGRNGNVDALKLLIASGADIKATDTEGMTALPDAVRNGYALTVKTLIEAGSDINERDSSGRTPLMEAAYYDYPSIVRYLISMGADIFAVDNEGHTALNDAYSQNSRKSAVIIKRAIKIARSKKKLSPRMAG